MPALWAGLAGGEPCEESGAEGNEAEDIVGQREEACDTEGSVPTTDIQTVQAPMLLGVGVHRFSRRRSLPVDALCLFGAHALPPGGHCLAIVLARLVGIPSVSFAGLRRGAVYRCALLGGPIDRGMIHVTAIDQDLRRALSRALLNLIEHRNGLTHVAAAGGDLNSDDHPRRAGGCCELS